MLLCYHTTNLVFEDFHPSSGTARKSEALDLMWEYVCVWRSFSSLFASPRISAEDLWNIERVMLCKGGVWGGGFILCPPLRTGYEGSRKKFLSKKVKEFYRWKMRRNTGRQKRVVILFSNYRHIQYFKMIYNVLQTRARGRNAKSYFCALLFLLRFTLNFLLVRTFMLILPFLITNNNW